MSALEYNVFRMLRMLRRLPVNLLSFGNTTVIFAEYFKGFEKLDVVKGIFGEKTQEVLKQLKVELSWVWGYMYVDGSDGHLVISKNYLNTGCHTDIYLDLVHELCHVKQFSEGKELFDPKYDYVNRPTEIEAYRYTAQEAKRIGLSRNEIIKYLKTEWMTPEDLKQLVKNIGL